jgi:hypothetical protein
MAQRRTSSQIRRGVFRSVYMYVHILYEYLPNPRDVLGRETSEQVLLLDTRRSCRTEKERKREVEDEYKQGDICVRTG